MSYILPPYAATLAKNGSDNARRTDAGAWTRIIVSCAVAVVRAMFGATALLLTCPAHRTLIAPPHRLRRRCAPCQRLRSLTSLVLLPLFAIAAMGEEPSAPPAGALPPGQAQPPAKAEAAGTASQAGSDHRIGTGDLMRVEIFNHPELTTTIRISSSGSIPFPLIGDIPSVIGQTVEHLGKEVKVRLEDGYLRHAEVHVIVLEFSPRRVFVLGSVAHQDPITLSPFETTTVLQAIGQAGGFSADADLDHVVVVREDATHPGLKINLVVPCANQVVAANKDVALQSGDILCVPRVGAAFVYVSGYVKTGGAFPLLPQEQLTVTKAISRAGGFSTYAQQDRVQLFRNGIIQVIDVHSILKGDGRIADPLLEPGDLISVP
jgi:polysaccharide biosynthesis/export protein